MTLCPLVSKVEILAKEFLRSLTEPEEDAESIETDEKPEENSVRFKKKLLLFSQLNSTATL